ncbi:MAG: hypothetical protein QF792_08245, partial [Phycisphaerae bacterium]|nr:hypothetical protein [Phycisphaerae bacterium]
NSVVEGEVYSTWTRTYFSGHYIPPFLLEPESTVEGKMRTVMSQEEFEQYNSGSAIEGTHEGVEHDEPSFTEYSTADFDTSAYRTQAANTLAASDDVQVSWFPDDSNKTRKFDRHNYQGQIFENTYIPAGRNAHFTNCTFRGVLFVETNETKTLGNWPYNKVRSHHWLQRDRHNTLSNNIVFENCRFEGKIVTAVPREFWWTKNSMTFTGSTVFDVPAGTDTTILAPNFNINIGDFNNGDSNSTVDGILVGGIVDIRDNAEINGTIMSMADLGDSLGSSIRHYGTNVGYYEGDVEGGYPQVTSHIRITPQPDNPLPLGIRKRCFARLVSNSYTEAAP